MRNMSRIWVALVSVSLGVILWTSSVRAVPLMIGETQFDEVGWVDWLVLGPGEYEGTDYEEIVLALVSGTFLNEYAYLYQIESNQSNTDQLTVRPLGPWTEIGKLGLDLDNWHNLPGEKVAVPQKDLVEPSFIDRDPQAPSWNFLRTDIPGGKGVIGAGQESWILYILSPMPPTFNKATLTNSGSSEKPLPVPSPEPTMSLLLIIGVAGLAIYRRRSS
ncbi:PEP-CTERM protein-sorting domain-containing protein [Candidatus Fervidibacteria bacterium JGI MDM2 JNZ-1-D12]